MFTVEKEVLAEALAWVIKAVAVRPNIYALEGVVIKINNNDTLTISAFNNEIYMEITIAAKCEHKKQLFFQEKYFLK